VVVGAGGEGAGGRVVLADELQRLDRLVPDHHVDVGDQEEAAGKPLVAVGAGDRDRLVAHNAAFGPPSAHQGTQAPCLRTGRRSAAGEAGLARFGHGSSSKCFLGVHAAWLSSSPTGGCWWSANGLPICDRPFAGVIVRAYRPACATR